MSELNSTVPTTIRFAGSGVTAEQTLAGFGQDPVAGLRALRESLEAMSQAQETAEAAGMDPAAREAGRFAIRNGIREANAVERLGIKQRVLPNRPDLPTVQDDKTREYQEVRQLGRGLAPQTGEKFAPLGSVRIELPGYTERGDPLRTATGPLPREAIRPTTLASMRMPKLLPRRAAPAQQQTPVTSAPTLPKVAPQAAAPAQQQAPVVPTPAQNQNQVAPTPPRAPAAPVELAQRTAHFAGSGFTAAETLANLGQQPGEGLESLRESLIAMRSEQNNAEFKGMDSAAREVGRFAIKNATREVNAVERLGIQQGVFPNRPDLATEKMDEYAEYREVSQLRKGFAPTTGYEFALAENVSFDLPGYTEKGVREPEGALGLVTDRARAISDRAREPKRASTRSQFPELADVKVTTGAAAEFPELAEDGAQSETAGSELER